MCDARLVPHFAYLILTEMLRMTERAACGTTLILHHGSQALVFNPFPTIEFARQYSQKVFLYGGFT